MPLSGDKFMRPLGPNSSIGNQIQTGTTILAANIRSQTRMFPKRRTKTNPLQHRETSSSPQTFQARNAAYERIANLQRRETSQTPEYSFFDEIFFLDKNTFLEDHTVIRTNFFSKHMLREDSKRSNAPRGTTRARSGRRLDFETPGNRAAHADKASSGQNPDETLQPGAQPTAENLPPPTGSNNGE
ncbi:hypothetical protein F2Q68_00026466 [Brassica cretica]|uniref:Uncharacterized protein n=2 Tax=Brassica cretica TaxID=69181 RepID=A0A8S9IB61_BRACR|nr:hypothetical protein F2Q68_00026466 [Brassica cretica]